MAGRRDRAWFCRDPLSSAEVLETEAQPRAQWSAVRVEGKMIWRLQCRRSVKGPGCKGEG